MLCRRLARRTDVIEKMEPWIKGKRILLLGYGREGRSIWNVLRWLETYKILDIADLKAPAAVPEDGAVWHTGLDYQKCMDDYDVVFKSPGIVLERPENGYRCNILSQTEVFFQCFRDQIIGITGTKGKSTVTTLLCHLLKQAGMGALLVGNTDIPTLDHVEEVKSDTRIMFELSCHQLEYMTVSLHIGILMNIHEEHLDHYGTMEKYVEARHHIFRDQGPDDILICNVQCLPGERTCPFGLIRAGMDGSGKELDVVQEQDGTWVHFRGESFCIPTDEIKLLGQHNYFDIGVAHGVCNILGMDGQVFARGPKTYEPLPHRLQYIREREGVKYYDDSISTTCDTTIQALETLKDTDIVLIGGMDQGIDYRELIEYLPDCQVPHIILMEATDKGIYQEIHKYYPKSKNRARLILAERLEDGAKRARQITRPGTSCVLSPVAASYGIFRNFEERGETFLYLVFNR